MHGTPAISFLSLLYRLFGRLAHSTIHKDEFLSRVFRIETFYALQTFHRGIKENYNFGDMKRTFGKTLLAVRKQKGLSQQQLADALPVSRSSVANWEADRRLPSATIIARIAEILNIDIAELLDSAAIGAARPAVIIVDDNKIVLSGALPIIEKALPNAEVIGFNKPSEAIRYAEENRIALAFLDIELGLSNEIDLCNELLKMNPRMNVVFLTA